VAEDAVQEACLAAVRQWGDAPPANPCAWLVTTARHKVLDFWRREAARPVKEAAATWEQGQPSGPAPDSATSAVDQLGLIFLCCHPALNQDSRVALTLRAVCGLSTAQIAASFLVPESAIAKRLVRARRKIRESAIPLRIPSPQDMARRLADVLRVVYLVFTEGHRTVGPLSDTAISLARVLSSLLPSEPEVTGLLALLLLTDARRPARLDSAGRQVLLADQDRELYDRSLIAEGERLLERALHANRPGSYQIQAAIAACHTAAVAADTDWVEISALYGELLRYDSSPVHSANRAIAVAMAEGPAAGLALLDSVSEHPRLAGWPQVHIARATLLTQLRRVEEAADAYRQALAAGPTDRERDFIRRRLEDLLA
jgi:RNA polymerase sigma-70 factor, ECF subfamily